MLWLGFTVGFRRRWRDGLVAAFGAVGVIWLATEIFNFLAPDSAQNLSKNVITYVAVIALIAVAAFIARVYDPKFVTFKIPTTNSRVTIKFGDFFKEQGDLVLAVNDFFDHEVGEVISANSIHGQLIAEEFDRDARRFRSVVDEALSALPIGQQEERKIEPSVRYPQGTVVRIKMGKRHAFLTALTFTDISTSRVHADLNAFWMSLNNTWEMISKVGNGRAITLPLLGAGRSGLNLSCQHILRMMVLSLVLSSREHQLPGDITIVLTPDIFEDVDLREIARDWKN